MNDACATNNAENVKPRIEASREDSTEAISRMKDGDTPVGGPLVSAEVSSRPEGCSTVEKSEDQRKEEILRTLMQEYGDVRWIWCQQVKG